MKTLKDIIEEHNNEFRLPGENDDWSEIEMFLKKEAREWIKELEKQKELHGEFMSCATGFNPVFKEPEGFSFADCYPYPFGYDSIIRWIKEFFNLDEN